jgi:hypothetical protein
VLFLASEFLHLKNPDASPFMFVTFFIMIADFPVVLFCVFLDSRHLVTPEINAVLALVLGTLWWIFIISVVFHLRRRKSSPEEHHP